MITNATKFNVIMPETTDRVLCVQIDKVITSEGYAENFLPRIHKMLENHGKIRLLIYYKYFKGWEENAAAQDMEFSASLARNIEKMAMVNAPEREEIQKRMKQKMIPNSVDLKFFNEEDIDKAMTWIKA